MFSAEFVAYFMEVIVWNKKKQRTSYVSEFESIKRLVAVILLYAGEGYLQEDLIAVEDVSNADDFIKIMRQILKRREPLLGLSSFFPSLAGKN